MDKTPNKPSRACIYLKWILWIGDCSVLFIFTLFLVMMSFYPPRPRFEPAVAILPYLFAWAIAGWVLKTFNLDERFPRFMLRTLLAWIAAAALAEGLRWLMFSLAAKTNISLQSALLHGVEGGIAILGWRFIFKLMYDLFTRPRFRRLRWLAAGLVACAVILIVLPRLAALAQAQSHSFTVDSISPRPSAIVFGAAVWPNGIPSTVLRARIDTAVDLFKAGKVEKLVLSGDGQHPSYDEIAAMRKTALEKGVPEEALIYDRFGLDTYDTCYRAKNVYHIDQAILVTQTFHLVRALFVCNALGLQSDGVGADRLNYYPQSIIKFQLREIPATLVDWIDVNLTHKVPSLSKTVDP